MSVKTIFLTSPHSNFFSRNFRAAKKVECANVRKIVARGEIEMMLSARDATNHGTKIGMWRCQENSSKA